MKQFIIVVAAATLGLVSVVDAAEPTRKIVTHKVKVAATNDEWVSTGIKVEPNDLIVVTVPPSQKVRVGAVLGQVGADGSNPTNPNSAGRLMMKIGTGAAIPAGVQKFIVASQSGLIKLKVFDTEYSDNSGEYEARVIAIPDALIPPAEEYSEQ